MIEFLEEINRVVKQNHRKGTWEVGLSAVTRERQPDKCLGR